MDATTDIKPEDRFVEVEGYQIRYLEQGEGPAVLLFHGGSLGSSADVFLRNIGPLAAAGFRVVAFDFPGFGLSDYSEDGSMGLKKRVALGLMDALSIDRAAAIGHSQAGNVAVGLGLEQPERITHVAALGTGSLLPPLEGRGAGKREGAAQARLEQRMAREEPTLDDTRKLLEANLFHHELITDAELRLRHSRSIGQCFKAFVARSDAQAEAKKAGGGEKREPLWKKLTDLKMPLLMIYGYEDRGRAADRCAQLKANHPEINLHMARGCKHLVPWDASDQFLELAVPFLKS